MHAIVFDKDGTLFDFQSTWSLWIETFIREIGAVNPGSEARVAHALGYESGVGYLPESIVIAGTAQEVGDAVAAQTGLSSEEVVSMANRIGETTQQQPVPRLAETLVHLAESHVLGLVTNDAEAPARAHLESVGIAAHFSFVAGYDSGHGSKPGPGQLLAFATATGIEPAHSLMVGDSRHDLEAGRAAGMGTVAVLTGVAEAADLDDLADVVLPDISHLPGWIQASSVG